MLCGKTSAAPLADELKSLTQSMSLSMGKYQGSSLSGSGITSVPQGGPRGALSLAEDYAHISRRLSFDPALQSQFEADFASFREVAVFSIGLSESET